MGDAVDLIRNLTGYQGPPPSWNQEAAQDQSYWVADNWRICELGLKPRPFTEGISHYIAWITGGRK